MTIELGLCIAFMIVAIPVSKSVAVHFAAFGMANLLTLGATYADASALALLFASLLAVDVLLVLLGGRKVLLISAAASALLCLESIMNMDWMISHITWVSAFVNAAIAINLAREYRIWTHGK